VDIVERLSDSRIFLLTFGEKCGQIGDVSVKKTLFKILEKSVCLHVAITHPRFTLAVTILR
jgi:hypothetical protein